MDKMTRKKYNASYKNRRLIGGVYMITCTESNKQWLRATKEMSVAQNRFQFSVDTNLTPEMCMIRDWQKYGPAAFNFEVLESIEKEEALSDEEFVEETKLLLEIWEEKMNTN